MTSISQKKRLVLQWMEHRSNRYHEASKYRYGSRSRGESSRDSRPGDYSVSREFVAYSEEEIQETDLYGVVIPKDRKLNQFKVYAAAEGVRPVDGSIVLIELTHYPEKTMRLV